MNTVTRIAASVGFVLASVVAARTAAAAPVVLTNVSGTATAQTQPDVGDPASDTKDLTVPSTGSAVAADPAGNDASITWDFADLTDHTRLGADVIFSGAFSGSAGGDLTLSFTTDVPVEYNLTVHAESVGAGLTGAIDANSLTVDFDALNDPVFIDTRTDSGTLAAGQHTFTLNGTSTIHRNTQIALRGNVTLELSSGTVAVIPLPSGLVPGIALLTCVGALQVRRGIRLRHPVG